MLKKLVSFDDNEEIKENTKKKTLKRHSIIADLKNYDP